MPTWVNEVFSAIIGPWGAVFVLCMVIYFLWKLFREEQAENRAWASTISILSTAVSEQVVEVRAARAEIKEWRDVFIMDEPSARRRPKGAT